MAKKKPAGKRVASDVELGADFLYGKTYVFLKQEGNNIFFNEKETNRIVISRYQKIKHDA